MPAYTEQDLQSAIEAVENGSSQYEASKQYRIPRSTLQNRLRGGNSRKDVSHDRQKLSATEEASLANWARIQYAFGLPLTHRQLRLAAQRLLAISGNNASLGKHWTTSFLQRNQSIKAMKGTHIEKSRMEAVTPEKIQEMYAVFEEPLVKAIRPQNRWNVDETGVMDGINFPGVFLGPSEKKRAVKKSQGKSDWRSIIECISAEGNALPPTVIFGGKNVQQQWFPDKPREQAKLQSWQFICIDSGHSCNSVGLEWLQTVFIPLTNPGGQDWRLLVLDGHESHISDEFLLECQAHRIWLAFLPPHSTHITQPLDVSVFSSLKTQYRQFRDDVALLSNADKISKEDFLMCYHRARIQAFSVRNIRSGWRQSGLWPVDISMPLSNPRMFQPAEKEIQEIAQETPEEETETTNSIQTPARGADVRKQLQGTTQLNTRHGKLVLRKFSKALDVKNVKIADQDRQIKSLKQLTRRLQPKKRSKVVAENPNKKFVGMPEVEKAKAKVARQAAQNQEFDCEIARFDDIFD